MIVENKNFKYVPILNPTSLKALLLKTVEELKLIAAISESAVAITVLLPVSIFESENPNVMKKAPVITSAARRKDPQLSRTTP